MKIGVDQLWEFPVDRFEVLGDRLMLDRIAADLRDQSDDRTPNEHWTTAGRADESMHTMLTHWVGSVGELPLAEPAAIAQTSGEAGLLARTVEFVAGIDAFGIVPQGDTAHALADRNFRMMDLHTLTELSILAPFLADFEKPKLRVLEIGGGFGRLAEGLQLAFPGQVQHVLIDAVPTSLMYSFAYLRARFPQLRVVFSEGEQSWSDVESADIVVLPSWRSEILPVRSFDLGINIASFQEMDLANVDRYFRLLDSRIAPGGVVALHNSRDYVFQGPWHTPENWEQLLKRRTPRSWTRDFPFEVFRVRTQDRTDSQRLHDYFYRTQDLAYFDSAAMPSPDPGSEEQPARRPNRLSRAAARIRARGL
ncbi:putative sugar O-methyltransferase [Protaetiibacter intestinalis]|uniref:putative sugar O-methyltransferase n=1 Tax=Protaetiibacter intestinalis TaxID=2419774 RepID=UPI0013009281|nr:putative sugar O-methyltransferase [Protaetiibacter intestinalis]